MIRKIIKVLCVGLPLFVPIRQALSYDFTPTTNPQTVTTNISLSSGNNTFTIPTGYFSTFTGVLSNASGANPGTLVKTGSGVLLLSGANTYSGGTLLQAGTIQLGNNAALGVWPTTAADGNKQGLLTVSGTGTIRITENRTIVNRFAAADAASLLNFDIASGTTLTIQNVTNTGTVANSYGSVLSTLVQGSEPIFTGGGNLVVQGNRSAYGGGIASVGTTGVVGFDLTELASVQFLNNTATNGNGGAVYASATGTNAVNLEFGDHVTISGNTATTPGTSGDGGGVYAYSSSGAVVRFGNFLTFSDNMANRYGGAIYVFASQSGQTADLFLGTNTLFDSNRSKAPSAAQSGGGALYSTHNASISGNTLFRDNAAMSFGGAILMKGREAGVLLLDTTAGDIGFTGNYMNVANIDTPTTGAANSVYLDTLTAMRFQGTGNVFFDDPIASSNKVGNKMVLGRTSASDPAANAFSGIVQLRGNSTVQNNFSVQVGEGTLRLAGGAQLAGATSGSFTLGADGTLAGTGTIGFGTNTISGTVAPDGAVFAMSDWSDTTNAFTVGTGKTTVDDDETVGTLTFTGATKFDGAVILVDIGSSTYDKIVVNNAVTFGTTKNNIITVTDAVAGGTYDVITSTQTLGSDPSRYFNLAGNIAGYTGFGRFDAEIRYGSADGETNNVVQVAIGDAPGNTTLYWTGVDSDQWVSDITTAGPQNWTDTPGGTATETRFLNGDRVVFDTTSTTEDRFDVTVDAGGVTVADMTVTGGGDYTITGNITAQTTGTTLTDATGKLVKDGTGTLTLNGTNSFTGGVEITGGTLKAATAASVGGNVTLSNASTLQFDNTADGTFASNVTGTGNLTKTNTGTLSLTGTNDYVGTTTVNAGTLVGNIASGTDLVVGTGATYEAGGADRTVSSLNGAGTVDMENYSLRVSSGDFTDGSIINADAIQKTGIGIFSIGQTSAGSLSHAGGTLNIAEDMSVVLTGTASIGQGTTLGIGVGDGTNPSLLATGSVTIGTGTTINITGYDGIAGVDMLLIRSNVGITGGDETTTVFTVGGVVISETVTEEQFINGITVKKSDDKKDLYITSGGLVWNNVGTSNDAHGYFYVADGATATISELLTDNTHSAALDEFDWDGKTLTKTGDGQLTLNYANDYTGNTLITAGTLVARNVHALGYTGTADIGEDATLVLNFNGTDPFSNQLSGAGNLVTQNNILIDRDNIGFTGTTTVSAGTLTLQNVNALGSSAVTNNSALVLDFTGTFTNALTGAGSLNLAGTPAPGVPANVTISRDNTGFTGPTTIDAGATLNMQNAAALGTSTVTNSGILNLDGFAGATFANSLSGNGQLNVNDSATVSRSNTGFIGDTNIASGATATLQSATGLGSTNSQTVVNDGTLQFALTNGGNFAPKLTGSGDLVANVGGILTLTGMNDYAGTTTVNTGTLAGNIADGTALTVASGAAYKNGTDDSTKLDRTLASLDGAGDVDMQGKNLTVAEGDFSDGSIENVDTFAKQNADGTLTVGDVTANDLLLSEGTLNIASGKKVSLSNTADIAAGTIMGVVANTAQPSLTAGNEVLIGTGTTLNVTGYNTSMGTVVLIKADPSQPIAREFGTYMVNGVDQTTTISLANYINTSPIVQRDAANLSQIIIGTGGLVWNNTAPGTAHGTFNVTGNATVDGNLNDNITGGPGFGWDGTTLTKTGNGTLTLTGNNGYTGGTTVAGGKIVGTTGNAFGTGEVTTGTGTTVEFNITGTDPATAVNDITGTGSFVKTGDGTLLHTGGSTYTGGTVVSGGTLIGNLRPSDPVDYPCGTPLVVTAGTTYQTYSADQSMSSLTGSGTVNMQAKLDNQNKNLTVCAGDFSQGELQNVATLTKKNAATSFVVGTATVGDLNLDEGTLVLAQQQTLTVTGATTIADNTTLSLANNPALVTGTLSVGNNTILDVCGCSLDGWVVKTGTNISINDHFTEVLVGGGSIDDTIDIDQFLNGVEVVYVDRDDPANPNGPGILLKSGGLVWNNNMDGTPNQAHGTFNIGTTFTVIQQLTDRAEGDFVPVEDGDGKAWDGKTLTKTGDGILTLANGTNSYSGGTNIQYGRIVVQVEGSLGSGEVRDNGILEYALTGDGTLANEVSGTGSFVKSGDGILTVTGTNTYTGGTTVYTGTLVSDLAAPTDARPCGTELYVDAGAVYNPYSRDQFVSDLYGAGTVDMKGYDLTVCSGDFSDGEITGVGTLTKTIGGGLPTTLTVGTVSAENLYLQDGTLIIAPEKTVTILSGDATIGASTTLIVTADENPALTAKGSLTFAGGGTTLAVLGYDPSMGTVVLINAGLPIAKDFDTYTLNGTDQSTIVTLDNYRNTSPLIQRDANELSQIIVSSGGLVWNNTAPGTAHGTFQVDTDDTVTENLRDNPVDTAWSNGWDGTTLTKTGTGNLTLTGENSYTGGTGIQAGTITATGENSLGTGAVDIDTDGKLVLDYDGTMNNTLRGDGDLEIEGNVNIVKSNTGFSGDTTVTAGTTTLQRADGLGDSDITLQDGTTLFFNTASSGTSTNTISGTGNLLKNGAGTLTLENDLLTTGTTVIRGGTLIANLVPADPATLPCGAALTVNAETTYQAKSREQFVSILSGTGTVDMNGFDLTVCSGDFTGGTFMNLENVTKKSDGTLNIDGFDAAGFTLREGIVILASGQRITLSGTAEIEANTVLDIGANLALTVSGAVTIDGTATLNVSGYSGQGEVVLVHSNTGITGTFGTYLINGVKVSEQKPSLDRYYVVGDIAKSDHEIRITGSHLAWYDLNDDSAHGTFRIDSGTVTISDALADVTDSDKWLTDDTGTALWDGETLTKTGAGTLVLGNENTFAGNIEINGGTIVSTGTSSLGSPDGVILFTDNDVSLVLNHTADGAFSRTAIGGGTIRKQDGTTLTVTSDLSGMTGVFRQDTGTVFFAPADNTFAGSYDQRGGTFEGVDGLIVVQDVNFEGGIVRTNGTLNVGGTVDIGVGTVMNIGASLSLNAVGVVAINDTAVLNITGYGGQGEVVVVHSDAGILGNFGAYTVNGVDVSERKPSLDVYYVVGGIKKTDREILITDAHLAWYDPSDNSAHGTFRIDSGSDTISESLHNVPDSRLWLVDENGNPLWDGKTLAKTGDGVLELAGTNDYTGATTVSAGTLVGNIASGTDLEVAANAVYRSGGADRIVGGLTGGGTVDMQGDALTVGNGEFCAGTLSNIGVFTKNTPGRLDVGGFSATEFHLAEGTLAICNNGRIEVTGATEIGDGTTFDIEAVTSLVVTDSITIGAGAALNITGYGGQGEVILVRSDTEIIGDFDRYTIDGASVESQTPSLLRYSIVKGIEKSSTSIRITDGHLAWYDRGDESAHGQFYIDGGSATISTVLADNTDSETWMVDESGVPLWDGKTLTKTGTGTLVLDAANTYTGNTLITAGTVVATGESSFGRIDGGGVTVDEGANLEIRYTSDGTFSKTVLGGGTIRKTDGFVTTMTADLSDAAGSFIQTAGTVDWQSGRFGGSYTQESGTLLGNGTMNLGGDAVFRGEVVPGGALTVDGDVTLSGADLYVNLYLNENNPDPTADFISGRTITIDGGALHVDDKGVASDYVHGSATFVVLKSTDGITGDFDTVTGFTSIFRETHGVVGNDYVIELSFKSIPFDPFAPNHNTQEVVTTINNGIDDPDLAPIVDVLINMDTDGDLIHAIDTMRGTEIVADGQALALWSPWRAVFNRLGNDRTKTACDPCDPICPPKMNTRNVWFEGYYRSEDVSGDGNARSYDTRRAGLMVGLDTQLNRRLTLGGVFGYGDPRLSSRYGKIETDDYTVALYGKYKLNRDWFTNAFVGYGRQEFDYRRHDFAGNYRAKYNGDAMYASFELLRPVRGRFVTWMPVAAVDFQKSWTDAVNERGTGFLQSVRKGELSRTELRFGMNAKARWNPRVDLLGRIQYSRQVGGNTRGTAESRFAMASDSRTMNLWGVDLGRDRLNVGVGAHLLVGHRKQSTFFCDYDFDYGKNSRAHTGQLGFSTKW